MKRPRSLGILFVALAAIGVGVPALSPGTPALAQAVPAAAGSRVLEIRVEGIQRIEPQTVRSYMHIRAGDRFDPARIDQSLKSLFATGLFADVSIRRVGEILIVRVIENSIINRIVFEGHDFMEEKDLRKEVQLRSRVVYTRTRVQNDVKRIIELYSRQGRFAVTVVPKVIQREQNRVDLIFEIDEGEATLIRKINFIGNKAFSDRRLRGIIQSSETSFYAFLTADDVYDPDRIRFDEELLRRYYNSRGYADFRVLSSTAELSQDREDFFLTFTVEEGARYRTGKVEIKSELKGLDINLVRGRLAIKQGDWYNAKDVEKSVDRLTNAVSGLGFAFIDIGPRLQRDKNNRIVSVVFLIREGPRLFVERINISGNVRTLDKVIRRELRLAEGDAFNRSRFNRSKGRVKSLNFFKKQKFARKPGSAKDKTIIDIEVEEKSTGALSLGAGVSSTEGVLTRAQLTEQNLLGKGQKLKVAASLGSKTQNIELGFTEPYFLERNLSAGFDVFRTKTDSSDDDSISFDRELIGFGLRVGFAYNDRLRQGLNYKLLSKEVTTTDSEVSAFIRLQDEKAITSSFGQSLVYDLRDSRVNTKEGYVIRLSNDLAGFGGDNRYLRTELGGTVYYEVANDWVLRLRAELGHIFGIGEDVRIDDRFFIGGDGRRRALRGFAVGGIGPRDEETGDALGGNLFVTGSAELSAPIGTSSSYETKGFLFVDMGTLMIVDEDDIAAADDPLGIGGTLQEDDMFRLSLGLGVGVQTPFGVIRLNYAFPILKADFDETEEFSFRFGTAF